MGISGKRLLLECAMEGVSDIGFVGYFAFRVQECLKTLRQLLRCFVTVRILSDF
jgi:hypothetical protein